MIEHENETTAQKLKRLEREIKARQNAEEDDWVEPVERRICLKDDLEYAFNQVFGNTEKVLDDMSRARDMNETVKEVL